MSRSCEFCGGELHELARSRDHMWMGCRRCQRTWREHVDDGNAPNDSEISPREPQWLSGASVRYGVAVTAVCFAFVARLGVNPLLGASSPFLFFTPAVMVAAWFGGVGPAIAATVIGAELGNQFFLRARGVAGLERWDRIAMFLLVGGLILVLTTVVRAARRRVDDSLWREQKARAEAQAANQAKDDFLSRVSHELQTPVSVVEGWVASIRRRQLRGEALNVALDAIERNSHIANRLVQDILDRTRIATGRLRMEPEIVSLAEILRAAVEQMRPTFDHNHVQLTTAIEETPYPMLADAVRLQQVFTNLLSNAAKFTPAGGHVSVALSSAGTTATVFVKDDGVGIREESLPHVFDGLHRDPRTAIVNPRGLGLGLSIARHFVERHGGTIRASSDGPGKGATFMVVFSLQPRPVAVEESRGREEAGAGALRDLSVLLVEDDDDARALLTETLEFYGAHVIPAPGASDAVRLLAQHHADVLLSDLRLPGEDGFALIHSVRLDRDPDVALMPAAAITASRSTADRHQAIAAGYQMQLQKPVDPDDLVSAILTLANMLRHRPERMH